MRKSQKKFRSFAIFDTNATGGIVYFYSVLNKFKMKQTTKRIRYGVRAMEAMKQEVDIRNKAIEALEQESNLYLSEKNRLGETNAWLTEQNDALRKEVIEANRSVENIEARNKDLRHNNDVYALAYDKQQAESKSNAMKAYIYKAITIALFAVNLILGAMLVS